MDVKTLCLGLLSARPASGYDLKKEFEGLFKHFFPAGYGSIYPALADLAAAKLVECECIEQRGRPDRKLYRITPAGMHAFEQALRQSSPRHRLRSEFLATLYFADLMEPERLQELLEQRVIEMRETVEDIDAIVKAQGQQMSGGAHFVAGFGAALAAAATRYIEQHESLLFEQPSIKRQATA